MRSVKGDRNLAVGSALARIRTIMDDEISVQSMESAKRVLLELCKQTALFPRTDFPVPDEGATERTFLIAEDKDGGYALYVNSGRPGQSYRPHNHGGAWAIVAAVEGEERHKLYRFDDTASSTTDTTDSPKQVGSSGLELVGEVVVRPGSAVSMLPKGIHSISAEGDTPLLHLHLYQHGFEHQSERLEFDLETGAVHRFEIDLSGQIEDAR